MGRSGDPVVNWPRLLLRVTGVFCAIAATSYFCFRIVHANATTAGFAFLLLILITAARWGLIESLIASVAAVLCFNFFFLPPVFTFVVADPQNWVALFAFLATAITASQLSTAVKKQASEATARQRDMERLYSISRSILLLDVSVAIEDQIAVSLARVFELDAVAIYVRGTAKVHRGGPADLENIENWLRESAQQGTFFRDAERRLIVSSIRLGSEPIGSVAVQGTELADAVLQGLTTLIAIGMERAKEQQRASAIEAAKRSDELKATLLDAIAHEFKTPLTSIKAAASTLLSNSIESTPERQELLTVVDEEITRLNSLVSEAIETARLDQNRITLSKKWASPREILLNALRDRQAALDGRPVELSADPDLPELQLDPNLMRIALRQVIDNASKYSSPDLPIEVSAGKGGEAMLFRIRDHGPGIPESEKERIFDRFYRSPSVRQTVPGAGLGLCIAETIVRAHGGLIQIQSPSDGGALFEISLPLQSLPDSHP